MYHVTCLYDPRLPGTGPEHFPIPSAVDHVKLPRVYLVGKLVDKRVIKEATTGGRDDLHHQDNNNPGNDREQEHTMYFLVQDSGSLYPAGSLLIPTARLLVSPPSVPVAVMTHFRALSPMSRWFNDHATSLSPGSHWGRERERAKQT
ncbi:hypothetical protein J6590_061227 [Homalodisca vitripennis]|nr:hypothetical protein J6590_061227 [Homalodisca vitripennis]